MLKREVKCGSVAFERGLRYFKHNTSFKVKRLNCDVLQRKQSCHFQDGSCGTVVSLKVFLRQQNYHISAVWNGLLSKHTKLKHLKA